MVGREPILGDSHTMRLCGIASIFSPPIHWELLANALHILVTESLGKNRCRSNVGKAGIAFDLAAIGDVEPRAEAVAVNQEVVGAHRKPFDSPLHSLEGGIEYVDAVYLLGTDLSHSPSHSIVDDMLAHPKTLTSGHLLGVVQQRVVVVGRQYYRRRKYRTGKAPSACLVTPRLQTLFLIGYFEHSGTKIILLAHFHTTNPYICGEMRQQQTDILKQPIPTLLFTFVVLLAAKTLRAVRVPHEAESLVGMLSPLGEWIDTSLGYVGGIVVAILSVVVASVIITRIISRYSLSVVKSLVPMVLFVVGVCGVVFPIGSPSLLLAVLMIVHATDLMLMSFKRTERFSEVMRASFWTGLATLMVPDMVYILALLPIQWIIWQRSAREMVAGTIMALLPLLPSSFCYWASGKEPLWLFGEWCKSLSVLHAPNFAGLYGEMGGLGSATLFGALLLLTLLSIAVFVSGFTSMRLRARKGHIYFTTLYFVGLFMLLFGSHPAVALPVMGFASVPLIHTFFVRRKGTTSAVVYVVVVALSLASALTPLF